MTNDQLHSHATGLLKRDDRPNEGAIPHSSGTLSGDYTKDRHTWLDGLTVDEILDDCQKDARVPAVKNAS